MGGVNYIHWERTTCPSTEGTQLLYKGVAIGTWFLHTGGGSEYLCLPDTGPEYLNVTPGVQNERGQLYGVEYESHDTPPDFTSVANHNVPCAACYTSARGSKIMIPGKVSCPSSWTREYYGYLMTEYQKHKRMSFVCMENQFMIVLGSSIVFH